MHPLRNPLIENATKVVVDLGVDQWHGYAQESLWAKRVGPGEFEVQNTPFFAKGLAYLDVVSAMPKGELLVIDRVIAPTTHSTYRILINDACREPSESLLEQLSKLGCTYESFRGSGWTLYAYDVPPQSIEAVYAVLREGLARKVWDFDEGVFRGRQN
jgi:Domain of unknown function (DUF4265)